MQKQIFKEDSTMNKNLVFATWSEIKFIYDEIDPQMSFNEFVETYEPIKTDAYGIYFEEEV